MIDYSLYLVTNREVLGERDFFLSVEEAIKGGVSVVQLREKKLNSHEFLQVAKKLKTLTDKYQIPLIINDNVHIAKSIDCAGVHVGQDDESLVNARGILGSGKIIGVSVGNEKETKEAIKNGADYLGIGTVFFTPTKEDIKEPIGLEGLRKIAKLSPIPTVAIGGIDLKNCKEVMGCGVDGVAIISAILSKKNIQEVSKKFKKEISWRT